MQMPDEAQPQVRMVDVGAKAQTRRRAVARATLACAPATMRMIETATLPKGDALATARVGAIMAAKRTADAIPLCHPLALTAVDVTFTIGDATLGIEVAVECVGRTGVEMEALHAASIAALTVYDMAKGVDRAMAVTRCELVAKSGGRSGDWTRESADEGGAG